VATTPSMTRCDQFNRGGCAPTQPRSRNLTPHTTTTPAPKRWPRGMHGAREQVNCPRRAAHAIHGCTFHGLALGLVVENSRGARTNSYSKRARKEGTRNILRAASSAGTQSDVAPTQVQVVAEFEGLIINMEEDANRNPFDEVMRRVCAGCSTASSW